jgi:hypothetical protein
MRLVQWLLPALVLSTATVVATAADTPAIQLAIKDHRFVPGELVVPANVKFRLVIANQDPTPEEFESHELNREKVVTGNGTITVWVGPLKPGRYPFFGDFNQATAQGALIAR